MPIRSKSDAGKGLVFQLPEEKMPSFAPRFLIVVALAFGPAEGRALSSHDMPGPLDARSEVSSETGSGHSGFRVGQNPDNQTGERNAVEPTVAVPVERLCQTIESAAREYDLPVEFFTRLIWQESRFDTHAISRAGAQGIAQFMPATAVRVGLRNPFDPFEAIMKSAEHLRDLRKQFGSLGLAAAAYNAGPKRVQDWLAHARGLPQETEAYVRIVTGRSAVEWRTRDLTLSLSLPQGIPCTQLALDAPTRRAPKKELRTVALRANAEVPWGVQLVGSVSETSALAAYHGMQKKHAAVLGAHLPLLLRNNVGKNAAWYRVRVGFATRESAEKLCSSLRASGGSCLVQRN